MLGQPTDNTVTGEKISKDYRDRYANFSKGAHFSFGGQGKEIAAEGAFSPSLYSR